MMNWDSVVAEHGPMVWRTLWRLLANRADVEECFQETFLGAFKLTKRETIDNWPAMLCRLAAARAMDRLRKRYRHSAHLKKQNEKRAGEQAADATEASDCPVEQAVANELSERLRVALSQLPAKQAEAFYLQVMCGWSQHDVALRMKISEASVGVNVHRARQRLQELFDDGR
jgi:RNA polymerase sigma-70 factor, ECF subfamily